MLYHLLKLEIFQMQTDIIEGINKGVVIMQT